VWSSGRLGESGSPTAYLLVVVATGAPKQLAEAIAVGRSAAFVSLNRSPPPKLVRCGSRGSSAEAVFAGSDTIIDRMALFRPIS
jgi:hypothetical protein